MSAPGSEFSESDVLARLLPSWAGPRRVAEGVLYILAFDNGMVKVGRTARPQQRVDHHVRELRRFAGVSLQRGWLSPVHGNYFDTEASLIRQGVAIAERVDGNEYFFGVSFDRLVKLARSLDYETLVHGPEVKSGGLYSGNGDRLLDAIRQAWPHREPDLPLPPREDYEDVSDLYDALCDLADRKDVSILDTAEMSWLDLQEDLMDERVEIYRLELLAEFYDLKIRVRKEGRDDLVGPMLPWNKISRAQVEQLTLLTPITQIEQSQGGVA